MSLFSAFSMVLAVTRLEAQKGPAIEIGKRTVAAMAGLRMQRKGRKKEEERRGTGGNK